MRRLTWLLPALLCACSGGLKLEEGNAFPCDFEAGEGLRDQGCPAGWVCGLEDRCQQEAPEAFVPGAPPSYAQQVRVSPGALDSRVRLLAGDARLRVWLADEEGATSPLLVSALGAVPLTDAGTALPALRGAALAGTRLALLTSTGNVAQVELADGGSAPVTLPDTGGGARPPLLADVGALRSEALLLADNSISATFLAALRTDGSAGEVLGDATYQALPSHFVVDANGGAQACPGDAGSCTPRVDDQLWGYRYADLRALPRAQLDRTPTARGALALVAAYGPGLLARLDPGTRWQLLNRNDLLFADPAGVDLRRSQLRRSDNGALWSFSYVPPAPARAESLATYLLTRSADGTQPQLTRAWDDCAPCRDGVLVAAAPVTAGALGVEVLCEAPGGVRSLWRVTGASVTSPLDACLREPLTPTFDLAQLSTVGAGELRRVDPDAVDGTQGATVSLAGASGQVWFGPSLSTLRPLYLDRTPLAATLVTDAKRPSAQPTLAALTEEAIAVDLGQAQGNGLTVLTLQELNPASASSSDERLRLAARVEGLEDWFVLSSGDLFKTGAGGGFGPRLLAPDGSAATGPFFAVGTREGARASMVIGAADQLYYWELDPAAALGAQPAQASLAPRLTPEPGFPIRSIARNRAVTLAGASERDVAGWVITSRNLFEFYRVRAGGRWALEPLSAGTEEPVELWSVGEPPAAYGRVGLRDGTVLRLPGGLPLTGRLSREGDARAEQVRDYASVGGWTLALGEGGLYQAVTPSSAGKLLAWTPVPLPAGVTAAMLPGGRLEVLRRAGRDALYLFTAQGFTYEVGRAP